MWALLTNKYVVVGLLLAVLLGSAAIGTKIALATIRDLQDQISVLTFKADSLQKANDAMARDVANVAKWQNAANKTLQTIRLKASQANRDIQNRRFDGQDPAIIQDQINHDMAEMNKRLENLSHAR